MNSVWWAVNGNLSPMPCLPSKLSIFPEAPVEYCGRPSWDCAYALKAISHESSEIQYVMEWLSCLITWAFTSCSRSPIYKQRFSTILPCETPNNSAGSSYFLIRNVTQCFLNLHLYILYTIVLVFSIIAWDIDH